MSNKKKTMKRLTGAMVVILLLSCCLGITAYALFSVTVKVEDNYFQTGVVAIDLNGGHPVIEEHEYLFEPGMTVEKEFYIKNESTDSVYYRLFFEEVGGELADVIEIRIWDPKTDIEYFCGTANELTKVQAGAADDVLAVNEKRDMKISFHYPEESGNTTRNKELSFRLSAEAVQTRKNPDKQFE